MSFKKHVVLLVDDLYQSGVSTNYVAMLMLEAGAKEVFGLACEKTCRNDDNVAPEFNKMKTSISFSILRLLEIPGIGPAKVTAILDYARKVNVDVTTLLENPKEIKRILSENRLRSYLKIRI